MSLVHRVLTFKTPSHWGQARLGADIEKYRAEHSSLLQSLSTAVVVNVDEVARFYCESEKYDWGSPSDFPCCAPPFPVFALSWTRPPLMRVRGGLVPSTLKDMGPEEVVLCVADELDDKFRPQIKSWVGRENREAVDSARWLVCMTPWLFARKKPIWPGYRIFSLVSAEGTPHFTWLASVYKPIHDSLDDSHTGSANISLLAITFLNCRNVTITDESDRCNPTPEMIRKLKTSRLTFKTLHIGPMKQVLRSEGKSDEVGLPKALHICRGHFAHYPNGIFNRTPGTPEVIWKPHHVRGKAENGIALKDYAVKVGEQG